MYQSSPFSEHAGIDFVVPLKNEETIHKTDLSIESLSNINVIEFDGHDDMNTSHNMAPVP
jgi:hypothetical protein